MKFPLLFALCLLTSCVSRPSTETKNQPTVPLTVKKAAVPPLSLQQEVLKATNEARSKARRCGTQTYAAARPLVLSQVLSAAAQKHAKDMAEHDFFEHEGLDGSTVSTRAEGFGYPYRLIGENIAAGYPDVKKVVEGWIKSEGHCKNLMHPDFQELGVGYAENDKTEYHQYWVQVLGRQR